MSRDNMTYRPDSPASRAFMLYTSTLPTSYRTNPDALSDKKIIVTGASSDLGHAVSTALAGCGAELIFIERKERLVTALYDSIVDDGYAEPLTVAFDLVKAEPDQLTDLAATLATEYQSIDGIVHLATSAAPLSPMHLTRSDLWQTFYQTAALKPLWLTTAMLPLLQEAEYASVIFSNLSAGRTGRAYWGPVGAANAALRNINETFAAELPEIRFNTLAAGKVSSAVRHKYYPGEAPSTLRPCDDPLLLRHFTYLLDPATTVSGQHFRVPNRNS